MGRKQSRLDAQFIEDFSALLKRGNTYKVACAMTNISESTFYFFMREAEALQADVDAARAKPPRDRRGKNLLKLLESVRKAEAFAEQASVAAIRLAATNQPGRLANPKWAAFWLERRRPKDWGRGGRNEQMGDSSGVLSPAEEVRRMMQSVTGTPEQILELTRDNPMTPGHEPKATDGTANP